MVERYFYGLCYGKGFLDGVGVVVKLGVRRVVMGMNVVINNVEDFYNFGKEKFESIEEKIDYLYYKRIFFFIENIDRNCLDRSKIKIVFGIRKL